MGTGDIKRSRRRILVFRVRVLSNKSRLFPVQAELTARADTGHAAEQQTAGLGGSSLTDEAIMTRTQVVGIGSLAKKTCLRGLIRAVFRVNGS